MTQVFFLLPDTDIPGNESIEPGQALLIGRNPDPARLDFPSHPL